MNEQLKKKNIRVILAICFGTLTAIGLILIIISAYSGLYSKGTKYVWTRYLDNKVYEDAEAAYQSYCFDYMWSEENGRAFFSHYYDELYDKKNTNFRFTCISDDNITMSGYYDNDEKKQFSATYIFSNDYYFGEQEASSVYYFKSLEDIEASDALDEDENNGEKIYISLDPESGYYIVETYNDSDTQQEVEMQVYVPLKFTAIDEYQVVYTSIRILYAIRYIIVFSTIVFALISFYYLFTLARVVGYDKDSAVIRERTIDRVPFDLYTLMTFAVVFLLIMLSSTMMRRIIALFYYDSNSTLYSCFYIIALIVAIFVFCSILLSYILSTIVRIRSQRIIKNTLISMIICQIDHTCKVIVASWRNVRAYIRIAATFIILDVLMVVISTLVMGAFSMDGGGTDGFIKTAFFLLLVILSFIFEICVVYNIYLLENAVYQIADGRLDYKIEEKRLLKPFRKTVLAINHISDGLTEALKTQIKSEHFKTELITNVSHDIKTPLTSIMNYVGLLQQTNVTGDEAKEYLEVLERQSGKLKKLIEDMIEASKASTGNLTIKAGQINIVMMATQAVAEYQDRFDKKGLSVKLEQKSDCTDVLADGQYLWRVFDNLLVNIYKYALENTRVYIEIEDFDSSQCVVTFKNISKYEIKVTPDELTERFVRGDKSRNTEGSGLGLSIARGIMESMNGKLFIDLDGDLYKAVIILPKYNNVLPAFNADTEQ